MREDASSELLPDGYHTTYTDDDRAEYWRDRAERIHEQLGAPIRAAEAQEARKAQYIRDVLQAVHEPCTHPADARRVVRAETTENRAGAVIEELDETMCGLCYKMLGPAL